MKNQTKKFWAWRNQADESGSAGRELELYGTIAEQSWFDDDITPAMFTDEGISGLGTRKRDGFNEMIGDAMAGSIDLIITKSVSRFARNTVDSLVTIRKLKEKGVEVYFEKENIWTFDGKARNYTRCYCTQKGAAADDGKFYGNAAVPAGAGRDPCF